MDWRPWRSIIQPHPSIEVVEDRSHPLYPSAGMTFRAFSQEAGSPRIAVVGTATNSSWYGLPAGAIPTPGAYGQAALFDGANDYISFQRAEGGVTTGIVMGASAKSVLAGVTITGAVPSAGSPYDIDQIYTDSDVAHGFGVGNLAGGGVGFYPWNLPSSGEHAVGPMPFTQGVPASTGFTHDGVNLRGYINGTLFGTTASGPSYAMSGGLFIGRQYAGSQFVPMVLHWLYFYNRVLTSYEMAWGQAEPWAFYLQRQRRAYSIPAPPAPTTRPRIGSFTTASRPWRSIIQPDPSIEVTADESHPLYPTLGFTFRHGNLAISGLGATVFSTVRAIGTGAVSGSNSRNYQATGYPLANTAPLAGRGEYGQAARFDGADDSLTVTDTSGTNAAWSLFMGASRKSVLAGFTARGAPVADAATYSLDGIVSDNGGYLGLMRGNRASAGDGIYAANYDGTDDFVGPMPYTAGVPAAAGYTHNGTTMRGYINQAVFGSAASGATANTTGALRIGANFSVSFFEGDIHWIYFYNRVLTDYEMLWGMAEPWAFYLQRQRRAYFIPTVAAPTAKPAMHYFRQMSA